VLSGRGLCDELITRPEESYRLCCVVVCDLETSRIRTPYIYDISHLRVKVLGSRSLFYIEMYSDLPHGVISTERQSAACPPSIVSHKLTPVTCFHLQCQFKATHSYTPNLFLHWTQRYLKPALLTGQEVQRLMTQTSLRTEKSGYDVTAGHVVRSFAGLSPRLPGFGSRPVRVGFVVSKVALRQLSINGPYSCSHHEPV
jgi:hypothetical protein